MTRFDCGLVLVFFGGDVFASLTTFLSFLSGRSISRHSIFSLIVICVDFLYSLCRNCLPQIPSDPISFLMSCSSCSSCIHLIQFAIFCHFHLQLNVLIKSHLLWRFWTKDRRLKISDFQILICQIFPPREALCVIYRYYLHFPLFEFFITRIYWFD